MGVRSIVLGLFLLGCGSATPIDQECTPPETIDRSLVCPGASSFETQHAPDGDFLCADMEDCSGTSGTPDHKGCPSTCSCLCFCGACYSGLCTGIPCDGGPVYR